MINDTTFDYSKLRGKIKEKFGSQSNFASKMALSDVAVSGKLNNKVQWTQTEIDRACNLLAIDSRDLSEYFFTKKVKEA